MAKLLREKYFMMHAKRINLNQSTNGMVFNMDFEGIVRQNSLLDFDRVMSFNGGEVVKDAVSERKTVRCRMKSGDGFVETYLKRHYHIPLIRFFSHLMKLSPHRTAFDEFRNIVAFHRSGLPTMIPVAAGIRRFGLFRKESFLVTKAIEGCVRLDHFFSGSLSVPVAEKKDLIRRVALLIRKMHDAGFNHRDLYLCHILIDSNKKLFLVDLHRVDIRNKIPERWMVKDISALNYSAPWHSITRTDRLLFLKTYFQADNFSDREKLFTLKVLKKTEKMRRHNTLNSEPLNA